MNPCTVVQSLRKLTYPYWVTPMFEELHALNLFYVSRALLYSKILRGLQFFF